eukprot:4880388-Amphidinium_carterae.1
MWCGASPQCGWLMCTYVTWGLVAKPLAAEVAVPFKVRACTAVSPMGKSGCGCPQKMRFVFLCVPSCQYELVGWCYCCLVSKRFPQGKTCAVCCAVGFNIVFGCHMKGGPKGR